jgi:hypothetical protein
MVDSQIKLWEAPPWYFIIFRPRAWHPESNHAKDPLGLLFLILKYLFYAWLVREGYLLSLPLCVLWKSNRWKRYYLETIIRYDHDISDSSAPVLLEHSSNISFKKSSSRVQRINKKTEIRSQFCMVTLWVHLNDCTLWQKLCKIIILSSFFTSVLHVNKAKNKNWYGLSKSLPFHRPLAISLRRIDRKPMCIFSWLWYQRIWDNSGRMERMLGVVFLFLRYSVYRLIILPQIVWFWTALFQVWSVFFSPPTSDFPKRFP